MKRVQVLYRLRELLDAHMDELTLLLDGRDKVVEGYENVLYGAYDIRPCDTGHDDRRRGDFWSRDLHKAR